MLSAQIIEEDSDMYGASLRQIVEAGDEAFELDKDYYTALRRYQNALELRPSEPAYIYKYAEAARLAKAYDIAEANYTDLLYLRKKNTYPLASFWLATIKQLLGKYTDAIVLYDTFMETQIGNEEVGSYYLDRAKREKEACIWSRDEVVLQRNVAVQHLGTTINTPNREFAPLTFGDTLIYSSMGFSEIAESGTERPYSKIMYAIGDTDGKMLVDDANVTDAHVANLAYNAAQTIKAFTRCEYLDEYSMEIHCQIYTQRKQNDGSWSDPQPLPDYIQQTDKTYTHPSFGRHFEDNSEHLYYVTDQEGGFGKLDIWSVEILAGGSYGKPKNLSAINTIEDDITPYFHTPSQTLYYSTEGRKGLGGFDIFKSEKGTQNWLESENLGKPINSSLGDVSFFLNESGDQAHFASNRKGSAYLEKRFELCCDDLYQVAFDTKIDFLVNTFDAGLLTQLEGATVELLELRKDSSTLFKDRLTNPIANDFPFTVERGKTYRLVATRDGYIKKLEDVHIPEDAPERVEHPLYLRPIQLDLQALTYELLTEMPLNGTTVQLLEVQEGTGEYKLLEEQINEIGNDFVFSLEANRHYLIRADKEGYQSLRDFELDTKGVSKTETYQVDLYLRRISFEDYLPLAIYFDNDYPDVDSRSPTTDADYAEMVDNYMARKEEYKLLFTEPMNEEAAFLTAQRYEDFFEREVQKGFKDLLAFSEILLPFLQNGNEISLVLKGYASPRAEDHYNFQLSARRIVSVENFFRSYEGGALMPYIQSGQLTFQQMPYGETDTYFFSDLLEDERNSIYSIGASLERRVEIVQAEIRVKNMEMPSSFTSKGVKD